MPPVPFAGSGVVGRALLGPTCPVMRDPPDPQCADRPVAGVAMVVDDAGGSEVGHARTDARGFFAIQLPAGSYTLRPAAIPNAMHAPAPIAFTVAAGPVTVNVSYDTGIR